MITEETMNRIKKGLEARLRARGNEVLARDYACEAGTCDFILRDLETRELVYVFIEASDQEKAGDNFFSEPKPSVETIERCKLIAADYEVGELLQGRQASETSVRFDRISVKMSGLRGMVCLQRRFL